jgi:predicted RND superfamily exporter protein
MKKYFLFLLVLSFVCPFFFARADVSNNLNFLPNEVWYSEENLKEGKTVNIYAGLWNGTDNLVNTKVEFYDKSTLLGSREVSVESKKLREVSVSWKITAGEHTISAKIISPKSVVAGEDEDLKIKDNATKNDRLNISVVVKDDKGEEVKTSEALDGIVDKAEEKVNDILDEDVKEKISVSLGAVEEYRLEKGEQIKEFEKEAEEKVEQIKSEDEDEQEGLTGAMIKMYFWKIISFIFENKTVFYIVTIVLTFCVLRAIYRAFRHRT